ncbi:MAG TPA: M28 family peptidase [Vicinamibacterales bacterium]|jgi:Zn-dependent M28 family amino/carboxypeptidase
MNRLSAVTLLLAVAVWPAACGGSKSAPAPTPAAVAFPAVDGNAVLAHTKVLSSDEYEGRAPGTKGEELTVAYISDQFKKAGLKPGNPDGTYIQKVPMVGITADPATTLVFRKGAKQQKLKFKDDVVAWTKRVTETVSLDKSEMVFVGYGVQAPEFNWDDYKNVDLKGKTMVVLINDPPLPDPADPTRLDPKFFGGRAMTYYGRWSYKYEMGQKMGAAGVLIVHETGPAAYPFSVVQSKVVEQFDLVAPDKNMSRAAIEGWITLDQAKKLFAMAGKDFDTLKKNAATREFTPMPLGVTASMTLHSKIRTIDSTNVVGKVEGSDPTLKNEWVIYTGHWDHYGIGPEINGDKIYHGAKDNATGIGGMIELGRAYVKLPVAPKRSILMLAVTAEEQGLLGSDYYARNPLYPLAKTLGVVNMDGLNVNGRTSDLTVTGLGNSELDDIAQAVAAEQHRVIKPDPEPEKGGYYRSDHFPFAKQGVPALASGGGIEYIGKPEGWGKQISDAYIANDYHKPSDKVKPDWDMSGAVEDLQYFWMVGYRIAQSEKYPQWKPGTEFKAKRDEMLRAR